MTDICKLAHSLAEPNSNYDSVNKAVVTKLKVVIDLLKGSPDEQYALKEEINNLIGNPEEINNYFK